MNLAELNRGCFGSDTISDYRPGFEIKNAEEV